MVSVRKFDHKPKARFENIEITLLFFTSSDPRPHKNTVIPVGHGSDVYSDIISGTSFWQGRGGEENSD